MTNKQIKDFYLSLIDNEETIWTKEEKHYDTIKWTLFNCRIGDISIESIPGYKLVFTHHGKSWLSTRSDAVSFSDIGISKFRLFFPYFGITSRIFIRFQRFYLILKANFIRNRLPFSNQAKQASAPLKNALSFFHTFNSTPLE